ncbi:MAG: MFS transporter [Proteobacteria bacterium]|nr:MFS transporter [Pseudomonadota bacterium]
MNDERPVKIRNLIAYGAGDIFGGGAFVLISMFYFFFLTEEVGLTPLLAGLVIGAGKVWDALSDPIMGHLSDHTRSRYGRRRVFFLIAIAPIALSFYLLWIPIGSDHLWVQAGYYSAIYIVFNTVFTMVMVPYSALNAEMSSDYRVRTRLTAARTLFSQGSSALAAVLGPAIRNAPDTTERGYFWLSIVFGALYALPWLFVFVGTWERASEPARAQRFNLARILKSSLELVHNRSFRIHILMYICAYTAMDVLLILVQYYVRWNLGREVLSEAMAGLVGAQLVTIPLYVWIANRWGKGAAFRLGLAVFGLGMAASYVLNATSTTAEIVAICAIIGAGMSAAVMMPWAILPSIIDVDEVMTTRVRSGVYAGAMTLIRKLVQGLVATQAIAIALTAIGYVESAGNSAHSQSPETIAHLKLLFFAMPSLFIVLGFVISLRFRITPETHAILVEELDRLRAGGDKQSAGTNTRRILEQLTGRSYDDLYVSPDSARRNW